MRLVLPAIIIFVFISLLTSTARALLRLTNRKIWHIGFLDTLAKYILHTGYFFYLSFGVFLFWEWKFLLFVSATGLAIVLIISLILIITLPVSLFINEISRVKSLKKAGENKSDFNRDRRIFLKTAAAALPVFTLGTTTNGVANSFQKVRIPKKEMYFNDLPDPLDEFKIWHLSDLHLGYYFQLDDLERLLLDIENEPVDLILITGDVADDLTHLTRTLELINQKKSSYTPFVSLGNHEYYRGIKEVRKCIAASPVPLLVNSHHILDVKGTKLLIGALDDPVHMHLDNDNFFKHGLGQVLNGNPQFDFSILMSHRPRALNSASELSINLILAGHTHGSQIGMNNRSVFENVLKKSYLWGKYRKGKSQLYTSSGVGHWFPFRLGCPAEAPIITLKKA